MISTNNKSYSYYPGCSTRSANRAYDISTRSVAGTLGIELEELDDWNCCGATAYVAIHEKRSFVLSARNLAIAEKTGKDLVAICSGCYLALRKASKYIAENSKIKADVTKALAAGDMTYNGTIGVRHFLDVVVTEIGEQAVRDCVSRKLEGLKVAPYYGCQIGRPFGEIDDPEDPQMMDDLIGWLGGEVTPFPLKAKCCGGLMMTTQADIGQELTGKILQNAKDGGADCIITACPLCQMNLEGYQQTVGKAMGTDCSIPVLYFTQLMGVAFGLSPGDLALKDSLTPVEALMTEKVHN
ncbi:MAG: CoB--CoM heterodisulfide reductase iron-sulfur subunit B family protein [Phycisphaerae bacterium]|nr:CoB--CoM heterodisulfide reductase iron-sulfur subunit B family protein [Phycisphaerae bacterium]